MQEFIDYNFLIIGRSGAGKSATSKLLTGDPSITVANSLNQVTKTVKFYKGISHTIDNEQIRFGILDIPGLDKMVNRFELRQKILQYLQHYKINLHGIIYVASLTERDTVEKNKLFQFINQLPWSPEALKSSLIPILTKYDNFIIDSPEEDMTKTKEQFCKIFGENGHGQAWSKRIYWVNFTKSLDFKMKCYEDVREKYENQIERLVQMIRKNKKLLTAELIEHQIKIEEQFVFNQFMKKVYQSQIPFIPQKKSHRLSLSVKIEPKKLSESVTAMSASSIGLIISRAIKNEIPTPISIILMGIPLSLTILNLIKTNRFISGKASNESPFNDKVLKDFSRICQLINKQLQVEWNEINKSIYFFIEDKDLVCRIGKAINQSFFLLDNINVSERTKEIDFIRDEKMETKNHFFFRMSIPHFEEQTSWEPMIELEYGVKSFEEEALLKAMESIRLELYGK